MNTVLKRAVTGAGLAVALVSGIVIGQATADQPHMQAALDALLRAKSELVVAVPDKGGHRLAAINAVDRAIMETRAGIRYAR